MLSLGYYTNQLSVYFSNESFIAHAFAYLTNLKEGSFTD